MSTSDGERSPKRQRLESYSPVSPPLNETKIFVGAAPNTPPPSVRMSPSWQSQSTSNQSQTAVEPIPTPPNIAGLHSRMAGKEHGTEEEDGSSAPASTTMEMETKSPTHDVEMTDDVVGKESEKVDAEHRRTDHEREEQKSTATLSALYKLEHSATPVASSSPLPSDNIIQMYGLQRIQTSVARRDAVTGEKINKLRKSYESKVKSLNLDGRNKATPNLGELGGLLDPGWDAVIGSGMTLFQEGHLGRELGNAAAESDIFSKLDHALQLEPVPLPGKEHEMWKSQLGLDEPVLPPVSAPAVKAEPSANASATTATTAFAAAPSAGVPTAVAKTAPALLRNTAPISPRNAARPERTNKKRRYDESSYAGYEYEDDGQPLKQRVRV